MFLFIFEQKSMFLFISERKVNVFVHIWTQKSMFLFIFEHKVNVFVYIWTQNQYFCLYLRSYHDNSFLYHWSLSIKQQNKNVNIDCKFSSGKNTEVYFLTEQAILT